MKNPDIEDPLHNKIDVDLWRRIFKFAMGHPKFLSPLAFSAVALSIIESQFPIATKIAVDIVEKGEPIENLWKPAALFFGLSISLSALVWVFIVCAGSISHNISHDIKRSCFKRLQELEFAYYDAQAAGERVMGLLATKPKIKDSQDVLNRIENSKAKSNSDIAIDGYANYIESIEFRNVGFRYNEKETVLEGFNLAVKRGETIALVGPSGGGKSTIVSLLSRFYEPTRGSLLFNGVDYRQRSLEWLQNQLGIVLQTPHLFNGTIRENIRYGNLQASDREIESAAQIVNGHEFIMHLSDGYDTKIGEGGARLSTGERQLISFARALIAEPQIFIMDEATSSIDTETEAIIQSSMQKIFAGRISFVIAHRLSTIRSADRILYIEKGRIVESGNHSELMEKRGRYHRLYLKQFRRERFNRELEAG